ncbi:BTAD domain-containing putative transcriptional regulator [Streptomyces sp. NPDC058739]|uniref:AfsR/SARP family transcriptional regulator n=1 Tax=Streptomyces sp. NPDC058739 TaxID=3346618 RepID=UPI003688489F
MQFRVLGTPGIYDDTRRCGVRLTSPKQRVLLGALLVRTGTPVPTDELIRELWGEDAPEKAGNALQAHVSRLRQHLVEAEPARANSPRLVARGAGYVLQARPDELDSVRFRLQVTRARRQLENDPGGASVLLRRALSLWRGPALDGGPHGPLCAPAAARLEEERMLALEDLCDASLRMGEHQRVVARLEELVAAHPLRRRLREQLALALQRCGRPTEARAVQDSPYRGAEHAGAGSRAVLPGNVRLLSQAAAGRVTTAPLTHPVAPEASAAPQEPGHELLRLRLRVEELTSQQRMLRSEMDRLLTLLEARTGARDRDSA